MSEAWSFYPFYSCGAILYRHIPLAILWSIWKEMNDEIFRGVQMDYEDLLSIVHSTLAKWASIRKEFTYLRLGDILHNWDACF